MYLENLHLLNFKSWPEADFEFSPKLNCFVGLNASGKTNLLDAIHYLSLTKSYFSNADTQNIKEGQDFFVIEGTFFRKDKQEHIHCALKKGQKKLLRKNKKEYERLSDHIGLFPSVVISPYDRDLITESSEVRRRFMDNVISQGDNQYLFHLMRYNKALQQRNTLLKYFAANHHFDKDALAAYDDQLTEHAGPVLGKRQEFIEKLRPKITYFYEVIGSKRENAGLHYQSQLLEANLQDLLHQNLAKDRINQYTSVGLQRDNLTFELDGRSVRKFGSQGQQKSFLIALKLAQYEFLKEKQNIVPVLLLDDIFDKLDEERVAQLVKLVHDEDFGQIFITDTHPERTENLVKEIDAEARIFNINHQP